MSISLLAPIRTLNEPPVRSPEIRPARPLRSGGPVPGSVPTRILLFAGLWLSALMPLHAEDTFGVAGITEPYKDATLSAMVAGRISTIHRGEGDKVSKGEVLVELDDTLEALEAARRKLIWESKTEVDSAAERVATVKMDLDGTRRIFESTRSVSKDELEQKELEYKLAVAELESLRLAERREELEYQMAMAQLERRSIRSPMNGVIVKTYLEEGENSEPQEPLIRVVDPSQCYFVCNVDAHVAHPLKVGHKVTLTIDVDDGRLRVEGDVFFKSPVADPASGLQEIKILFDNADGQVSPGVTGELRIVR